MKREEFRLLCDSRIVLLDGATGTNLQKAGMPAGVCPELWMVEHEDAVKELQMAFLEAGTDILYAPTFSANRIKLEEYGLENRLEELNTKLVHLSKGVVEEFVAKEENKERTCYVAGDLTMTGQLLYPVGKLLFEELVEVYKEQVRVLLSAGVDLFVVETMMSLQECRAAVLAVKEECDLPVMVTLTFAGDEKTMYGTTPEAAVVVLQSLGADAVGVNCSAGPETLVSVIERMVEVAEIPVIAKPNAGLPSLEEEKTVYKMTEEEFATHMEKLVEVGAGILGGCCGSEPKHIRAVHRMIQGKQPKTRKPHQAILATERTIFPIKLDEPVRVIGERINPTGKKALQAELREGKMDLVLQYAKEQEEAGAYILDVNAGMSGIDEKERLLQIIYEVTQASSLPLSIDSSHVDVIEQALRIYPGRALVNSISCEQEKMEQLLPIVKKYGAMFILLPLSENGLPKDQAEKREFIHTVMEKALEQGFTKEDIVVDGLVTTVGANKMAALETLETIRYCKENGLTTTCGLSNISFGLPERIVVNTAFLTMAIREGLTMAIANPNQDLLVAAAFASDLLLNKDGSDIRYIEKMQDISISATAVSKTESSEKKEITANKNVLYEMVLKGKKNSIAEETEKLLTAGADANDLLNSSLLPAINDVGEFFDKGKYFLPQLIASAEAMKNAIAVLQPRLLQENDKKDMPTIVFATVEGDIHDIGKNLVVLMLQNYGYHVIDLGKDISKEEIVEKAIETKAAMIGLSALMTTTMQEMKEVVVYAKEKNCQAKIMIGGAVITEDYKEQIGADGYAKDAAEAVKVVQRLLA